MEQTVNEMGPIRVGISTCLLGEKVRFDATHKKDAYITDVLGRHFEWVPVCPEIEVGMGVPREAVRLTGSVDHPAMVGVKSGSDWTAKVAEYSARRVRELERLDLSGFIFKSGSPSCGMERVRIYSPGGMPVKAGRGIFARAFLEGLPLIPVEDEGRLCDGLLRENFIVRVFAYHRLRRVLRKGFSPGALVRFHTIHKYLLLAHSPKRYQELGRIVAGAKDLPRSKLTVRYSALFMEALAVKTTVRKNTNVLHHILGFLKDSITTEERRDILAVIDEYHRELLPLVVPVTLLAHYVKKHRAGYIADQVYLAPSPEGIAPQEPRVSTPRGERLQVFREFATFADHFRRGPV